MAGEKISKPLVFVQHAEDSLRERAIEREWVEETVRRPEWRASDPEPERERRYRAIPARGHRILRVVVVESDAEIRILTAFLDRKARRP